MAWRILIIGAFIAIVLIIIAHLKVVVVPFLVGLLIAALLFPFVRWLVKKKVPKSLAVALSIIAFILVVSGLVFLVVKQTQAEYPELHSRFDTSLVQFSKTLASEPFNFTISKPDIDSSLNEVTTYFQKHSDVLISGLTSVGRTIAHAIAGILLTLFTVIFLLYDGANIWSWAVKLVPKASREKLHTAGILGWKTLTSFVKSQAIVAAVNGVGIGLGAAVLQVPLALPIAVLVFLGSFIPFLGAIITGTFAVVLALVFNGWVAAIIMLGVVLLVQFLEGHVLQPFIIGKAVRVHPLAVVFVVAIGSLVAGVPGALFAVPTAAVLNVMLTSLFGEKAPTS